MKQTAVEWLVDKYIIVGGITKTMVKQAKAMEKEQKNQMYNETEVLQLLLKLIQTESFDNLKEWFEQNKKTCYHPLTERRHTSDTHFECTICGYNNY
jgi:hypothetical protein